jgi:hypothetical protein
MNKEEVLEKLSVNLAEELLNRISSGEAAPADLNVARQLLKDNNITVVPQTEHPAQKLALVLPFEEKQQAHG